jgi:hypothetical protein
MARPPMPPHGTTEYLRTQWGLRRGKRRLAELRANGGGPLYHRAGNEILYFPDDVDAWAEDQLGAPLRSTSEEAARRLIGQPTVNPITSEEPARARANAHEGRLVAAGLSPPRGPGARV